ncbi:major facilitator superfamily domain-containing protein [Talaromyces proteolyticus]|uniref:Major facilitator superfamily domain-containing protein n=1 Tax=Talaromyces proteolyticus TaxID=1131652 RepID=A0AAD4L4F3_9EURO|nr:major facilitator superfamily domain-containing protein [Talaromyces proteolyticus]KAH8705772.1 major facilitator superfamily domain-containing protein [Talaromyces proteolyticus]
MEHAERDEAFWAPGTIVLENTNQSTNRLILHPFPSEDPNDPLNWSTFRKALNFGLVCFFVLWTFVQLDIGSTAWGPIQEELGFSIDLLNSASATNYAALAVGCMLFIPFVHKYGRRPVYLFSSALQFAASVWSAETRTSGDLIGSNFISGLGGAISETIVQITIADMFFVHQHATLNACFVFFQSIGAFLGPVASGYVVDSQGWKWMWWWCVIFLGANLLFVTLFFEESKYVPVENGKSMPLAVEDRENQDRGLKASADIKGGNEAVRSRSAGDVEFKQSSYRQRLALITKTDEPLLRHFYQPIIVLFRFPAVGYTALTWGCTLSWFSIMTSVQATYLIEPPYNFDAVGVGLMNLPPFIGAFLGFFCGYLNDKSIIYMSNRNVGIYEPEMRLWMALPLAIITPAGMLMFGIGLADGVPWIVLAVGFGIFGFGLTVTGEIALSYLTDCYQDIVGDALVGVVFVRNIFSVIVLFALTPWIEATGILNLHIQISAICFAVLLLPLPLIVWGKKMRISTAEIYRKMTLRQSMHRMI